MGNTTLGSPGFDLLFPIPAAPGAGDRCGYSLAAADADNDGFDELAFGCPWLDFREATDGGAVFILQGGPDGLSTEDVIRAASGGARNSDEHLGYALAFRGAPSRREMGSGSLFAPPTMNLTPFRSSDTARRKEVLRVVKHHGDGIAVR